MPDLDFMKDVKYLEVCCEADRLIGNEMETTRKTDGKLSSRAFPSFCADMAVNLKKGQRAGGSADLGEQSELLTFCEAWKRSPQTLSVDGRVQGGGGELAGGWGRASDATLRASTTLTVRVTP